MGRVLRLGLVALALAALPVLAQESPVGPAGVAFYTPVSPLPQGAPGDVLRVRPLDGTMALPGAARSTLAMYLSRSPQGRPMAVTGSVSLPRGKAPEGGWPVILWMHGTTGLAAVCGPSRDSADGPEHAYVLVIRALLDQAVAAGYAVVATDYQGLGMEGIHPFLQGVPNAQNALDLLKAARRIEPDIGTRFAVMGHSQGGQAELFTAALAADYLPGFELVGNVAMAPGSQIAARVEKVRRSGKVELSLPYVTYAMISYSGTDPAIDLSRILMPPALAALPELYLACMTHALTTGFWSTAIASEQFRPDADLAPFLAAGAKNEPGTLDIPVPTLIFQGTADITVFPQATDLLARQLCERGTVLEYRPLPGADHDGSMTEGAAGALDWLADRFAGQPARSNCDRLPAAHTP
jgi:pimeloyl-ACP methyl ester carboxylesterase